MPSAGFWSEEDEPVMIRTLRNRPSSEPKTIYRQEFFIGSS